MGLLGSIKPTGATRPLLLAGLAVGGVIVFAGAVMLGDYDLSLKTLLAALLQPFGLETGETVSRMHEVIVWKLRLPRLCMAALTGMAMGVSGAVYQGCFRNPLVEPYILGVSAGAAFGASLAIVFPLVFPWGQVPAFGLALVAVLGSFFLARTNGRTPPVTLILSGIIVAAIFTALVGIMKYVSADAQLREITFWMMGGFYFATWHDVGITAATVLPAMGILGLLGWRLNILSLGDEEAKSLGINPDGLRMIFIVLSTLVAAVCVSAVGIIAWVGLMMPHAARMLFGPDNRWVIPGAALLGGIYLIVCDTIARTLTGAEIPIAIVTSIVGAPYLLWLLRSKGRELQYG